MTKKAWVTADPHFGHVGVTQFLTNEGIPLRPWDNIEDMDNALVERWNSVVGEFDRVYLLGDVVINRRHLHTLYRLKGKKVLVKGNHDIFALGDYLPHFEDIRGYAVKKVGDQQVIMSHIPIHEQELRRFSLNIHGHLHSNVVRNARGNPDKRYVCVSVEHTDFTPITLEEAVSRGIPQNVPRS